MNVLSIQSHVAYGRVGNRSAVFPLERLGFEVWPINTVQFSCHTGIPGWTGAAFGADHVTDVVKGLEGLGVLSRCDAVLSGYMGDAETGAAIVRAVDAARRANPAALYCCDPVMGDVPEGVYVQRGLPEFIAAEAVPRADIVSPNVFEAEMLSGATIATARDAAKAADAIHAMGPRVVLVTSFRPSGNGGIGFFVSDGSSRRTVLAPMLPFSRPPKGSGDLASALFLGYYLGCNDAVEAIEMTIGALYSVLEATLASGGDSLALVSAQGHIASPVKRFLSEAVG
ncbi:MAG: pyridoxal kinase PdxY [Spirochaetes bacterium]|nr:pyridoxal kinase PdxY [Spirochaetota bacterium]MBU1079269.1 pyridoxal kinase PdxY [Spirochaetota bacterium]